MGDQLSRFERIRLFVFYRSRNTCCLSLHRRTQAEFRLPTSRFTTSPDRFSWESIAYWRYFLEASVVPSLHRLRSHRKCGVLSLCIPKELNWIAYRGSQKKYRNDSCLSFSCRRLLLRWAERCSLCCRLLLCCLHWISIGRFVVASARIYIHAFQVWCVFSVSHMQLSPKTLENVHDVAIFSLSKFIVGHEWVQVKIPVVVDNSIGHYRREIFSRYTSVTWGYTGYT